MADENILPRDQNHVTTAGFENSLVAGDVRPGQIIVATGRIKMDSSGGGSGTVTEIDSGTGIKLTPDPIIATGTVALVDRIAPIATLGSAGQLIRVNAGATALEYFTASAGGVTSVVGTSNRITVDSSTPAAPIVDIAATYVGQTSITTLGTVATGTWNATVIADGKIASALTGKTYNGLTITSSTGTLTIAAAKVLTVSNTLTFTGTDGSSVNFGTGGTVLYTASTIPLTVGTTTIASGTTTRILYDNAGVLGEYTITGTGTVVAMQTSPAFTTPSLGVATATSINKVTITAPATSSILTIADGKTLTASVTMTLQGGDASVLSIAASKTFTASNSITIAGTDGKTLTVSNSITLAGTDATVMTFPSTSQTVAGLTATQTFTNKRISRRVVTTTQSATPTINTDNTDVASITGLAQAITSFTTNLSGTPVAGDFLEIQITDDGTARGLTFGTSFAASTVALPTTTVISTLLHILFEWNTATSKWVCVAVA